MSCVPTSAPHHRYRPRIGVRGDDGRQVEEGRGCWALTPASSAGQALTLSLEERGDFAKVSTGRGSFSGRSPIGVGEDEKRAGQDEKEGEYRVSPVRRGWGCRGCFLRGCPKTLPFTLSLSKGRGAVHGSTSSPRTVSDDLLDTLSGMSERSGYAGSTRVTSSRAMWLRT